MKEINSMITKDALAQKYNINPDGFNINLILFTIDVDKICDDQVSMLKDLLVYQIGPNGQFWLSMKHYLPDKLSIEEIATESDKLINIYMNTDVSDKDRCISTLTHYKYLYDLMWKKFHIKHEYMYQGLSISKNKNIYGGNLK